MVMSVLTWTPQAHFACVAVSPLRLPHSLTSHHVAACTGGSLVPIPYRAEVHEEASDYFLMGI